MYDKDHLVGFRDEATMFDVDTKARREPLPMTSTSGTFQPVYFFNSEMFELIKGIRERGKETSIHAPVQNIIFINPES